MTIEFYLYVSTMLIKPNNSQATSHIINESSQPGPMEEGTVTVDTSLSRSSSLASEIDSNDSQNTFFHRQYHDTKPPVIMKLD